ncbi:MAG: D-methionine transport system ATP-binding protein [Spirochaetes bacterium]|nr:MAG: D-methionine transport system ATP-binding protein [Spirochaetota bacterium]
MFHATRPERAAVRSLSLPQNSPLSTQKNPPSSPIALELKEIGKTFGPHRVLDSTSLSVPQGRIQGIIGRSGAGKTTLIRIASLLERPDEGTVFFSGTAVSGAKGGQLLHARRKAGFVFQNFNLFASRTVAGNVAFPLEAAHWEKGRIEARVEELLALVGLADKASRPAARLSGGERQRVAIARALANNPELLFCDEATSALDPETTRSILDLIKSLRDRFGLTVLMVTHQMEVVRRICDDVAIIAKGSIVESGSVGSVFENPRTETARRMVAQAVADA